jgi:nicotinate-nucleotide pyrophosphorylase
VSGPCRMLLTGERTALNFVQRLSGIATLTSAYVRAVEGTGCRILDTRKTTPGLRRLEKMAAAAGGAVNHRMGLYDAVLIKNNHIAAAGGVRAALERTRRGVPPGIEIEIEVRTRAELDEALACGAAHLLLDNLAPGRGQAVDRAHCRPGHCRASRHSRRCRHLRHHAGNGISSRFRTSPWSSCPRRRPPCACWNARIAPCAPWSPT